MLRLLLTTATTRLTLMPTFCHVSIPASDWLHPPPPNHHPLPSSLPPTHTRRPALRPLLTEAGTAKLVAAFESLAAHRANLDVLVDQMGGG